MKLKIAFVVHGRWFAFDWAGALQARGHRVVVFTNYPTWAARRFGLLPRNVRSFPPHAVLSRLAWALHQKLQLPPPEAWLHRLFGRWAAARLRREPWDVIFLFSGVAEEGLRLLPGPSPLRLLMRASSHIRTQARILEEEERRTGVPLERPSPWMIAREEREYMLSDRIVVPSSFAHASFLAEGAPAHKMALIPLAAQVNAFRLPPHAVEARCERIASGRPLRVLYVGTLSFRKGLWDLAAIVRGATPGEFEFQFVGPVAAEARPVLAALGERVNLVPKQPQHDLARWYAWGDVFVFPTIEDGAPVVLAQAHSTGLPILTTPNSSGPDLIEDGQTGWVLPIRTPEAFLDRLRWSHAHRQDLAAMVRRVYDEFQPRGWDDVAADFEALGLTVLQAPRGHQLSNDSTVPRIGS